MTPPDSTTIPPLKQCKHQSQCIHPDAVNDGWLPSDKHHFEPTGVNKGYLRDKCRRCRSAEGFARQIARGEDCKRVKQAWRDANREHRAEYARAYYEENRDRLLSSQHEKRRNNLDARKAIERRSQITHREQRIQYGREYRRLHPEKTRNYYQTHIHIWVKAAAKRRSRLLSLPHTLTRSEWEQALQYFNGCCAVCGNQLRDLLGERTAHADHWIPLTSTNCPGTTAKNIVPLCGGVNGCNNRKRALDPRVFLESVYGRKKAPVIMKRVETYFASLT